MLIGLMTNVVGCLEGMGQITISVEEDANGYSRITITSLLDVEDVFKAEEFDVLQYVRSYFHNYGSRAISEFAHQTEAWRATKDDEIIPYSFANSIQLQ